MKVVALVLLLSILAEGAPSTKKGLCVSPRIYECQDLAQFTTIVWWYDWSLLPAYLRNTNCTNTPTQERVPMQWGWWRSTNITGRVPEDATYVLGFNEPNHREQANMTPQKAAEYWPRLEAAVGNKILVSPSAANCGGGTERCVSSTIEWFDEFFRLCNGCRVDYLATHHYHCNADATMAYLRSLYARYGKKIWLTEFACPNTDSFARVSRYMTNILPQLEAADFVYRYSWFNSRIENSSNRFVRNINRLLTPGRAELTRLGRQYNNFQPA
ncbi:unnamed protein product [Owenia fusiformis]|uniref:Asl1-like glycosyl hydrolase catalytic domain-containing protein n=1 Tax=Owenia fusiformis TaxID=6347 RepID=A0A8J1THT1_OWEFU|nr:unnamed protein product [Owenia fusiformis]